MSDVSLVSTAQSNKRSQRTRRVGRLEIAMPEWIHTLTVDASYDAASCVIGVGIVIQSRSGGSGRGPIIDRIAEAHIGVSPGQGEMFAVLRALEIAKDRGFTRIRLRSDYNSMRRNLRERFRSGALGKNDLQQKILDLARQFEWIALVMSLDGRIKMHMSSPAEADS